MAASTPTTNAAQQAADILRPHVQQHPAIADIISRLNAVAGCEDGDAQLEKSLADISAARAELSKAMSLRRRGSVQPSVCARLSTRYSTS
jgi:hypothetical protein